MGSKREWIERAVVLGVALVTLGACSDDEPTGPGAGPAVAYVEVVPEDLLLVVGDTATLAAKLYDEDENELTGRTVTWASSSTQFVTVDGNGKVRAVKAGGPVLVTATAEGMTGPAFVVVADANPAPVVEILDPASVSAGSGPQSITILGQGFEEDAEARWNGALRPTTWVASGVLEIDLTAEDLAQAGQGQIRVFNPSPGGGLSAPLVLQIVNPSVEGVVLGDFPREIDAGQVITMTARAVGALGQEIENRPVVWSSSDETVATVTPGGVLMGHRNGVTVVRAEIDGRWAETPVAVRVGAEPVAYVFVEPHQVVTLVGRLQTLSALVISTSGAEITGRPVTWLSMDPTIVEIDAQGTITPRQRGTTTVKAMAGGQEGTARIEVREYPVGARHLYDLRLDPGTVLSEVADTTWMVNGTASPAKLHLTGATFEVDRSNDTYRLVWTLQVALPGVGFVAATTRTETGTAVRYTRGPTDYGYTVTPAGGVAFEVPAGLGDLTMTRSLGAIANYPFYFVIR